MQQEKALAILKSGQNVFLTGFAGSGKTYCLNQYIHYLHTHQIAVAITASTGIAATHLNGMTIHAWSGIGIRDEIDTKMLKSLANRQYMRKKMDSVKVLIIDEISMLHKRQFELVDKVLRHFKGNELPFGGVQLVLSGDFFQLPPVGKQSETAKDKFSFMSPAWLAANFCICYLDEQYRSEDSTLEMLLNDIRQQKISASSQRLLAEKIENSRLESERFPHLYPHNADVDAINRRELSKIPGKTYTYLAIKKGNRQLGETLVRNILAPEELSLKSGAKVMFVKNNPEKEIYNGTLGEVIGFADDGTAKVRLFDGREVYVETEVWQVEDEQGKVLASVEQVPLRLAWAITVHKSQGMTLDEATVDLSHTFERGQGYVALSRLRTIDGLRLLGINNMALSLEPLTIKADKRFRDLSDKFDKLYSQNALQRQWRDFIQRCGGEVDPEKLAIINMKKKKLPTQLITKTLLLEGNSLEIVAEKRGLKVETIINHLVELKSDPDIELSKYLNQDKVLIEKLKPLIALQKKRHPLQLKPLYDGLNGAYSYSEIKKALLFIPDI